MKAIMRISDRVVVMNQGEKIAEGPPGDGGRGAGGARRLLREAGGLMLHVEGLQVRYGQVTALWDVGFDVAPGEIVALVGANGAGKTTTLKAISGLLRPEAGTILLDGEPLENRSTMEIVERGVVHVPEGRKLFPEMTVRDNLLLGGFHAGGAAPPGGAAGAGLRHLPEAARAAGARWPGRSRAASSRWWPSAAA